jgi:hypothetical protein
MGPEVGTRARKVNGIVEQAGRRKPAMTTGTTTEATLVEISLR